MAFAFSEKHIVDYHTFGYTIFRSILPTSLIGDLRRVTDRAREIAREESGPQSQRLQPVGKYDLNLRPFQDYAELPELYDAVHRLLTPEHSCGGSPEVLGILIEPAERAWVRERGPRRQKAMERWKRAQATAY
jgi:hypothetical protein